MYYLGRPAYDVENPMYYAGISPPYAATDGVRPARTGNGRGDSCITTTKNLFINNK